MSALVETSLRDEQVERTRERILAAAIALLADESFTELTIPLVAKRAGVAVRTVYRYFPSKDALLAAVAVLADGRFGPEPFPDGIAELRRFPPVLFEHFDESEALMRAGRVSPGGRAVFARTRQARIASAERALAPLLEELPAAERRRAVAAVYSQNSVGTYLLYRDSFGLSSAEAAEVAAWVVGLVVDELERGAGQRAR